jgi:hypothetical protein
VLFGGFRCCSLVQCHPTANEETLLNLGFAVLVAMLLAPHGGKYGVEGFGPF